MHRIWRLGTVFDIHQFNVKTGKYIKLTSSCLIKNIMADAAEEKMVSEGKAQIYLPASVFYNPVQEFNRDLTIAVISQYSNERWTSLKEKQRLKTAACEGNTKECPRSDVGSTKDSSEAKMLQMVEGTKIENDANTDNHDNIEAGKYHDNGLKILEGLAASGLRSMRFALEIPGVKQIVANDFDQNAVSFIEKNIQHNKVDHLVTASYADASMLMYQNRKHSDRFDVIDLDPYGSAATFLDAAVQAVKDEGLLCVTCTDAAVLCGNAPETCYGKYGAVSLKGKFCHEMALRIVLQSVESHCNRYSRYTVPLLSISADFYVRVFVKVFTGQGKVKQSMSKMAMVYHCPTCGAFHLQNLGLQIPTKGGNYKYTPASGPPVERQCAHCGSKHHLGGPIWAHTIHDCDFVGRVIATVEKEKARYKTAGRIIGMLSLVREELPDAPLYYVTDAMCNVLHCTPPNLLQIRSAILNAGYQVSMSHAAKNSLKTNASSQVMWDILRCWVQEHPVKAERLKPGTPVKAILDQAPSIEVSFELHPEANPASRKQGLLRWQANPERDWGPKAKAKRSVEVESQQEKRRKLQGKRYTSHGEVDLKKYPCKKFHAGECEYGDQCCYSHELTKYQLEQQEQTMDQGTAEDKYP